MSFLKELIDSFGSIFSSPAYDSNPNPNPIHPNSSSSSSSSSSTMEGVSNERVAHKLKGYHDLATEEIAKAVRAEEWGLVDDAILHYKNAQRILLEASSTPAPSYITSSEQEKVKSYRQKISKWQGHVSERLQALSRRAGGTSTSKSPALNPRKDVLKKSSSFSTNSPRMRNQTDKVESSKPTKDANSGYEDKLVEMINTTIVDRSPSVKWEDVAGLEKAKQALMEMVILPTKRRDLFTGLRRPARGLLLFGPPGNGKTMLAKAVASESEATFFNVSASSLTSKWVGEAEKLVRALFMVAKSRQPSVIFMDEVCYPFCKLHCATNKPQELDDAVLRRLVKRIYIPLPDENVRRLLLKNKLKGQAFSLPSGDIERLARVTEGYSGSDLQALCEEAAMMPIRELGANILTVKANQVRPLRYEDFHKAMTVIRPSLNKSKWEELEQWNEEYGSN
ncbi:spastin isoform X2 [Quercus lobata]|uniref:spastin isoform X2 n=1 Tax=Quercus lobata TaxID=97700 RepID=UPI001245870F|nr:spastin isoform X2 [Quercus lobata]